VSAPQEPRRDRPEPVVLPGGAGLFVPGETAAELASALELLTRYVAGVMPPASVRAPKVSPAVGRVLAASMAAAVEYRRTETRRSSPAPTPQVLPAGQPSRLSDEEEITTRRAADLTGVSREWIRRLWHAGEIRGHKVERDVLMVNLGDVRRYDAGAEARGGDPRG
jgi:excisionase family DNA binding protein